MIRMLLAFCSLGFLSFTTGCAQWADAAASASQTTKAICVLRPTAGNKVRGVVRFTQVGNEVRIHAEVTGLTPGLHGFHVHEFGDVNCTNGKCTGGHFNPEGKKHGKPTDAERHVGDLGNLKADAGGKATYDGKDSVISFTGSHSIIGRGIVVHAKPDDFGQPTGNAGARVAVGVIGLAKPD